MSVMTKKTPAAFAAKTFFSSLLAITLVGCATPYRGPGEFLTGAPSPDPSVEETSPTDGSHEPKSQAPMVQWDGKTRRAPGSQSQLQFDWPVDTARMTRGFFFARRSHWGLDLANTRGTPILASERGTVIYAGRAFKGYGRLIVIEHDDRWATLYAHLDKILVKEGQLVQRGHRIGTMGRSGRASGVHLHFEMRKDRQPINPLAYLPDPGGLESFEQRVPSSAQREQPKRQRSR